MSLSVIWLNCYKALDSEKEINLSCQSSKTKSRKLRRRNKDVLEWFKSVDDKKHLKFINWDIDNFYASITPKLLEETMDWATEFVDISAQQRKVIIQACQSFLFFEGQPWMKKGGVNFDVGMGAYHGAQVCELVGLHSIYNRTTLKVSYRCLPNMGSVVAKNKNKNPEKFQCPTQTLGTLQLPKEGRLPSAW